MSLAKYISPNSINIDFVLDLEFREEEHPNQILWKKKKAILEELVRLLDQSGKIKNSSRLFTHLFNREKKSTTGLGEGFALPHVRSIEAKELAMALLRVSEGVDFDAIDKKPVYLFLAMVAPPYDDNLYLRIYRDIAKGISSDLKEELLQASHIGEVYGALKKY